MEKELGKINKPDAANIAQKRKLLLIPLLYASDDAPEDYKEKFDRYWQQVDEQIKNLELKIGSIIRVYHESLTLAGEDGLEILAKINPKSFQIVKEKCQSNAKLEIIENKELAEETVDWERCLYIGLVSNKVARQISEFYIEASKKRYEYIGKGIDETLKEGEVAILFIREGHSVQFPKDIEVFSVSPPALDEIYRWIRDQKFVKEDNEL